MGNGSPVVDSTQVESHLEQAEAWLHTIAGSGIVGLVHWAATGEILEANDTFLDMLGVSREDLRARRLDWRRITPEKWRSTDDTALEELRRVGRSMRADKEYVRPDGSHVFVRLRSAKVGDDPEEFLSLVVDLTREREMERERDVLLERERRARLEAESAVHARDAIISIVAHDLRNFLNTIALASELCTARGETNGDPPWIIRRAVASSKRLISDLLDAAQIASGQLAVAPEVLEVGRVVDEVCALFQPQARAKSMTLRCRVADGTGRIRADRHRLVQILSNLVGNAVKFTPEGGQVTVVAERSGDGVTLTVEDTGRGVDAEDLGRIFEPFWQARRVRRGGVGLGLPVTRGLVDAHGGRIWAESRPGLGSRFCVWLPESAP